MLLQDVDADLEYLSFVVKSGKSLKIPKDVPLLLCSMRILLSFFVTIFN